MRPDPIRLYESLSTLRHVRRYSRQPLVYPQNVAEHSFYVAVLARAFARQIQQRETAARLPIDPIDREAVVEAALLHDAAEAFTSDLPHDVKRASVEIHEAWVRLEQHAEDRLEQYTGDELPWPLRKPKSLEARIVKIADRVELLLYVRSENRHGNHALDLPAVRIWEYLTSQEMALAMRNEASWYADLIDRLEGVVCPQAREHLHLDHSHWGFLGEGGDKP